MNLKHKDRPATVRDLQAMEARLSGLILQAAVEKDAVKLRELEHKLRLSADKLEASVEAASSGEVAAPLTPPQ
jgi:hypothetical protein